MPNVVMSEEFAAEVAKTVRKVLRQEHSTRSHSGRWQGGKGRQSRWAITNVAIAKPSNGVTTPTVGEVEFLEIDTSDNLKRTGDKVTLTHRWEGVTLTKDTLIRVVNDYGEWVVVGADCSALVEPPT